MTPLLRSRLAAFAIVIAVALGSSPAAAEGEPEAPLKIGVVNLEVVLATSEAGKALKERLKQHDAKAAAERERIVASAKAIRRRVVEKVSVLAESYILELKKQLEDKEIELRRLEEGQTRAREKLQGEGLQSIDKELSPIFSALKSDEGYDLILNEVKGMVLAIGPRVDLTERVVRELNATLATTEPPAAAGG